MKVFGEAALRSQEETREVAMGEGDSGEEEKERKNSCRRGEKGVERLKCLVIWKSLRGKSPGLG